MWKALGLGIALSLGCGLAWADVVTLTDGTVLRGKVSTSEDSVTVSTAAGDIKVAKDKVASMVPNAAATSSNSTDEYLRKIQERRERYGNSDGIHHEKLLNMTQFFFTVGEMLYNGDALNASGSFNTSDFDGINLGLMLANSFSDNVGWEAYAGYSPASKNVTLLGAPLASQANVTRLDFGFSPRLQILFPLQDQGFFITPHVGLGPVVSYFDVSSRVVDASGNVSNPLGGGAFALGGAFHIGVDLQLGNAIFSAKLRYFMSYALGSPQLNTTAVGALVPQAGFGWVF